MALHVSTEHTEGPFELLQFCLVTCCSAKLSVSIKYVPKTVILSWLQNGGFSKDQLKGKQLSPTFQPDALVVFRAIVKLGAKKLHYGK